MATTTGTPPRRVSGTELWRDLRKLYPSGYPSSSPSRYSVDDWEPLITAITKERPSETRPDPALVEAVVSVETGQTGFPFYAVDQALGGRSIGLGQISTRGLGYGHWLESASGAGEYRQELMGSARLSEKMLYDPAVNLSIAVHEIDYRQEQNDQGGNWLKVITMGYFGGGTDTQNGTTTDQYYDTLVNYILKDLGPEDGPAKVAELEGAGDDDKGPLDKVLDTGKAILDLDERLGDFIKEIPEMVGNAITGVASDLWESAQPLLENWAIRAALFVVALGLLILGAMRLTGGG